MVCFSPQPDGSPKVNVEIFDFQNLSFLVGCLLGFALELKQGARVAG
jgi:hypothetical protein